MRYYRVNNTLYKEIKDLCTPVDCVRRDERGWYEQTGNRRSAWTLADGTVLYAIVVTFQYDLADSLPLKYLSHCIVRGG